MLVRNSLQLRYYSSIVSKSAFKGSSASKLAVKNTLRTASFKVASSAKTIAAKPKTITTTATSKKDEEKDHPSKSAVYPNSNATVSKPPSQTFHPSDNFNVNAVKLQQLNDSPTPTEGNSINWAESFHGLGVAPFPREVADILLAPLVNEDIEIKLDGLLYLPEIKYRRILNRAFGPGGWGLAPRTESLVTKLLITREYGLICHGRLVSVARGEQDYFGGEEKIPTALEGCKSNALMRCCKDLGIASELWDPSFIRKWKAKYADEVFAEHAVTKKKKKLWKLKTVKQLDYPYKL